MRRINLSTNNPAQLRKAIEKQYCTLYECFNKSLDKVDINAQPDEVVLNVFHKHWFVNVRWILTSIFSFIFPAIVVPLLDIQYFSLKYKIICLAFWYLILGIFVFESFIDWFFDTYIITNKRVISVDFSNYISKRTSEASLSNIQDISARVSGFSQTIFNYGTVLIQTASSKDVIVFKNISNPECIADTIDSLRSNYKIKKGGINE